MLAELSQKSRRTWGVAKATAEQTAPIGGKFNSLRRQKDLHIMEQA